MNKKGAKRKLSHAQLLVASPDLSLLDLLKSSPTHTHNTIPCRCRVAARRRGGNVVCRIILQSSVVVEDGGRKRNQTRQMDSHSGSDSLLQVRKGETRDLCARAVLATGPAGVTGTAGPDQARITVTGLDASAFTCYSRHWRYSFLCSLKIPRPTRVTGLFPY
jgi:hypothetical protein